MQLPSNELADIALRDPHGDAVPLIDARVAAAIANPLGQSPNGSPVTEGKGSIAGTGPRDSLARGNPRGVPGREATVSGEAARTPEGSWHTENAVYHATGKRIRDLPITPNQPLSPPEFPSS
jgi:hypothetical protein